MAMLFFRMLLSADLRSASSRTKKQNCKKLEKVRGSALGKGRSTPANTTFVRWEVQSLSLDADKQDFPVQMPSVFSSSKSTAASSFECCRHPRLCGSQGPDRANIIS